MIIFLGLLGLLIFSVIFMLIGFDRDWEAAILLALVVLILFVAVGGCIIDIIGENIFISMKVESLNAERDALLYQLNHNLYLGDAIGVFNSKIIYGRAAHLNPWVSWFYGPYYMEVEPIPLT